MQGTEEFKKVIKAHLEKLAEKYSALKNHITNPDKNLDDCTTYILNKVKDTNCLAFADDEIYAMALHYYITPDIQVGKPPKANIVVPNTPETEKQNT